MPLHDAAGTGMLPRVFINMQSFLRYRTFPALHMHFDVSICLSQFKQLCEIFSGLFMSGASFHITISGPGIGLTKPVSNYKYKFHVTTCKLCTGFA